MICCFRTERGCSALVKRCSADGKPCAYYKTQEAQDAARDKAYARIRKLPSEVQEGIANSYYGGKKKW